MHNRVDGFKIVSKPFAFYNFPKSITMKRKVIDITSINSRFMNVLI